MPQAQIIYPSTESQLLTCRIQGTETPQSSSNRTRLTVYISKIFRTYQSAFEVHKTAGGIAPLSNKTCSVSGLFYRLMSNLLSKSKILHLVAHSQSLHVQSQQSNSKIVTISRDAKKSIYLMNTYALSTSVIIIIILSDRIVYSGRRTVLAGKIG